VLALLSYELLRLITNTGILILSLKKNNLIVFFIKIPKTLMSFRFATRKAVAGDENHLFLEINTRSGEFKM
jgi:hypothetical protein